MTAEKSIFFKFGLQIFVRGKIRGYFHDYELIVSIHILPETFLCGKIISKYILYSTLQDIGVYQYG